LAIAIIGLESSSSVKPSALNKDLCGALSGPFNIISLLRILSTPSKNTILLKL
jgi:hypothetical protein